MLKKTITYTDFDGNERTEDFYFNFSKAELAEMEMSTEGGLRKTIDKIVKTKDAPKMFAIFKDLLLKSYGEKSPDGKRFIKSKELSEAFSQTEAYSIMFMELGSSSEAASAFVNAIVPSDVAEQAAKERKQLEE